MLYAWIGFLRRDAEDIPQSVQDETADFLGQPLIKIRSAGELRDASGKRAAMIMIFEDTSQEAAERFVATSPYLRAGLYQDHQLYEFVDEVG